MRVSIRTAAKGFLALLLLCRGFQSVPPALGQELSSPAEVKLQEEQRVQETRKAQAREEQRKAAADRARPKEERDTMHRLEVERRTKATSTTLPRPPERSDGQDPEPKP